MSPPGSSQRDPREQGHNVLLDRVGGNGPAIVVGVHLDALAWNGGNHSRGMVHNDADVSF